MQIWCYSCVWCGETEIIAPEMGSHQLSLGVGVPRYSRLSGHLLACDDLAYLYTL